MASEILSWDGAYRPDYKEKSWHNQEITAAGKILKGDQIPNVAYPVTIEPAPEDDCIIVNPAVKYRIIGNHPDGKLVFGNCSSEYAPIGNDVILEKAFEAFQHNNIPADLVFALTMKNGMIVSYSFEIEKWSEFFAGGRPHKLHACITSSHNKSQGLLGFGTATNVLCANSHRMAMRGQKHSFSFKFFHNSKGKEGFSELPQLMEALTASAGLYSKLADEMAGKVITVGQARAIAAEILFAKNAEANTRAVNAVEEITDLFQSGIANKGQNLFDLVNAVTQLYTHGSMSSKVGVSGRLYSSEFGTGAEKKEDFLLGLQTDKGELISDDELNRLVAAGEKRLKVAA